MRKLITYFCLLLVPMTVAAQRGNYKVLGDAAFEKGDYYTAAFYYKQAVDGKGGTSQNSVPYYSTGKYTHGKQQADKLYITFRLAESYRLYKDYTDAAIWYSLISKDKQGNLYPLTPLWYGICLQANGNYDDALQQLKTFVSSSQTDTKYIELANKAIADCGFAKQQTNRPLAIDIKAMPKGLNSGQGDYALSINQGSYWFTSSRIAGNDKVPVNQVYTTSITDSLNPAPVNFRSFDKNAPVEYATPSLTASGKRMYLTRWYNDGKKTITAIYLSEQLNGKWQQPQKLNTNVNADGFSSKQPFVTADGRHLFFTSDKPGGEGGDDIWISDLDATGQPVTTSNLGNVINTAYAEQAPYYDEANKKLFYSSAGFTGMGGFDLFTSTGEFGKWAVPVNMGYPVNSPKDDLYYTPDPADADKFYFSSGRGSDCCLSLYTGKLRAVYIRGKVIDCNTQKGFVGAHVVLKDPVTKKAVFTQDADASGNYIFRLNDKQHYLLDISAKGYFTKVVQAPVMKPGLDTLINPEVCLQPYKINVQVTIKDIHFDFAKAALTPESLVILDGLVTIMNDNPRIKIEMGSHTDAIGSDADNLRLSQARAQACVNYLIAQGINAARITAKGYGESMPIAPNSINGKDNPAGRQLNRRTTFTVKSAE